MVEQGYLLQASSDIFMKATVEQTHLLKQAHRKTIEQDKLTMSHDIK